MKPLSSAFSPDVMAELARPFETRDPRNAQIIEGKSPRWYVVEVYASAQPDVVAELSQHRYGIYIPEFDETIVKRGRKIERRVPMFPGYVFVFVWPTAENWSTIVNIRGVVASIG